MDFLILLLFVAPFAGGFVLDLLFGTWARWWRWWFPPLLPVLLWAVLTIRSLVVEPADNYGDYTGVEAFKLGIFYFGVLVVMTACGVGLRRWAALRE